MKFFKSFLSFFLFSLVMSISVFAQETPKTGTIKGILTDFETKAPLIGANVEIPHTVLGAATDMDGHYIIPDVPAGSYSLTFSYIGYETSTRTDIIVRPGRLTFVNADLKISSVEADAVVVNAGYFTQTEEQPTSITNFTAEEIRRAPGSAGDVSRIIYGLPAVAKVNDTKNSLLVRGGSALENGFYVDNIEVNNINHFPEQGSSGGPIGMINVDFIEDVNFYTGGFSADYGDRLSSIMDLKLREGNREEFDSQLDLNFGGFGGTAEGPLFNGKGSWMFSARRSFLDFIVGAIGQNAASVPQYGDVQTKVVWDLSPQHRLTLLDIGGLDAIGYKRNDAVQDKVNMYNDFQVLQNTAGLNWRYLWGENGYSNTAFSHAVTKYDFSIFDTRYYMENGQDRVITDQNSMEQEYRVRNVNHFKINDSNKLDFGLEAKLLSVDYDNYYGHYNDLLGNPTPILSITEKKSAAKMFGFLSYSIRPFSGLTLTPGIRAGYFTYNKSTNISPRFSAALQLSQKTTLNFSSGIYYQNLPLVLLSHEDAHKELKTPEARHMILGLSRLLSENTMLTVELYDKQYYHFPMDPAQPQLFVIDEMNFTGLFLPHEILVDNGRARSRGVELMVQKKLARDIYGMISTSYSRSQYRDFNNTWHNRIADNRFTFNIEGGYKPNNKWEFSTRWIYAGGAPYTPFDVHASMAAHRGIFDPARVNGDRMPDYHSLNVRFDRRFFFNRSNMVFYLSIWNAYGRQNIGSYYWNEIENKQESQKQWTTLPIFGVEFEL